MMQQKNYGINVMTLNEVNVPKVDVLSIWNTIGEDPFYIILSVGLFAVLIMLLLLRIAFVSMGRADKAAKKLEEEFSNASRDGL